ncbi:MAG: ABC transporter permease [Alphaproteobacteria bacterium]|nr:ABC transporter permease [Alphaproteobacteria bacterium]
MDFIFTIQRPIVSSVTGDLSAFADTRNWLALLAVMPLGVVFGAIHALTPGHSKTVLATYVAGSPVAAVRSIGIATILALTHVLCAVAIAVLALPLISRAVGSVGRAPMLEDVSRGLLAAIGVWMIVRAFGWRLRSKAEGPVVAIFAGLVPCPLTLFAMMYAIGQGVPEAGLMFAASMTVGIAATLVAVALIATFARNRLIGVFRRNETSLARMSRVLEGVAGVCLLLIGINEVFFH